METTETSITTAFRSQVQDYQLQAHPRGGATRTLKLAPAVLDNQTTTRGSHDNSSCLFAKCCSRFSAIFRSCAV